MYVCTCMYDSTRTHCCFNLRCDHSRFALTICHVDNKSRFSRPCTHVRSRTQAQAHMYTPLEWEALCSSFPAKRNKRDHTPCTRAHASMSPHEPTLALNWAATTHDLPRGRQKQILKATWQGQNKKKNVFLKAFNLFFFYNFKIVFVFLKNS